MSTVLVSLGVMVVAIAGVLAIVLTQPDQPATLRRAPRRARRRQEAATVAPPATPTAEPEPDVHEPVEVPHFVPPLRPGLRPGPVPRPVEAGDTWVPVAPLGPWDRLRSGFALVVVLAVVGTLLAIAIGAAVVVAGLNLRDALRGQP